MGLLSRLSALFERRASSTTYFGPPQEIWLGATDSDTGENVSVGNALRLSAVYACVRVLSETVGSLPVHVYERQRGTGRGSKQIARDHYLYDLLHNTPYEGWTSMMWREFMVGSLACYGNAYSLIYRDGRGRPQRLQPWHANAVKREDGRYYVKAKGDMWQPVPKGDMLHIRGLVIDPGDYYGVSPITYARRAIGMGLATDKYGAKFFANAAMPKGLIQYPGSLDEEAVADLKKAWQDVHGGVGNANKVAVLQGGLEFKPISIPNDDAQWIETRKFTVTDVARIFRVPPHMIGDLDRATFSNVEQQSIDFVVHTIRPWLVRIEQEINATLFPEDERDKYFCEFVVDGLLRGDIQSRYGAYATAINWGWMSPNDVRDLENLNPVKGGDQYMVPLNMVPMDSLGAVAQPDPENDGDAKTRSEVRHKEERARGANNRRRIRNAFKPIIEDAGRRLVRSEIREIRKALDANRAARDRQGFGLWLENYYGEDFRRYAQEQMRPVFAGLAAATIDAAETEVNARPDAAEVDKFVEEYTFGFASRHANASRGQLQALDTLDEIEERLDDWEDKYATRIRDNEAVRLADAVAVFAFAAVGISRLMWVANADACPLCEELDGRVVGIDGSFVSAGGSVDPQDGKTAPLVASSNVLHAPLHLGCDCSVVPE